MAKSFGEIMRDIGRAFGFSDRASVVERDKAIASNREKFGSQAPNVSLQPRERPTASMISGGDRDRDRDKPTKPTEPVVVEITLAFVHRRSQVDLGGGGAVKSFFGLQLTGSEAIDYKKVSPNVSELMPATIVANSTVPAGQTLTMTVFAEPTQQSGWVMSVFWAELQFRWAAIKR